MNCTNWFHNAQLEASIMEGERRGNDCVRTGRHLLQGGGGEGGAVRASGPSVSGLAKHALPQHPTKFMSHTSKGATH